MLFSATLSADLATVCPIIAGSDLPVSRADPIAIWRHLPAAFAEVAPGAAETMALPALLTGGMATTGPLLDVGTAADFVVWSRDPLEELPAGTPPAVPLAMVVAGEPTVLECVRARVMQAAGDKPPPYFGTRIMVRTCSSISSTMAFEPLASNCQPAQRDGQDSVRL